MGATDWTTLVVALLTFAGVLLNLWFTFQNRNSIHKDFLYRKQVEEYDNFISLIVSFDQEFFGEIFIMDSKAERVAATYSAYTKFLRGMRNSTLYFSNGVVAKSLIYEHQFFKVVNLVSEKNETAFGEIAALTKMSGEIIASIRESLGLPELSNEILKSIGVQSSSKKA